MTSRITTTAGQHFEPGTVPRLTAARYSDRQHALDDGGPCEQPSLGLPTVSTGQGFKAGEHITMLDPAE